MVPAVVNEFLSLSDLIFNLTRISEARRTQTHVTKHAEVALALTTRKIRGNFDGGKIVSRSLPCETIDLLDNFRGSLEPLFINTI